MNPTRLLALASAAFLAPFSPAEEDRSATPPEARQLFNITVSLLPHAFLVNSIGGDHVSVTTLVTSGQDPHQFNITPTQTVALAGADAFFTSGMPFEAQFILKIREAAPSLKIVQINKGITLIESPHAHEDHEGHEDEEGHEGHDHSGPDPHTWTSPALLAFQAVTIHETLAALAPQHAEIFSKNLEALLGKIFQADEEITARLKPHKGKSFFVFHPAFKYFANQYGLTEISIETDGKQPTPKQLLATIEKAGAAKAKSLFIQPQFDTATTQEVARQIGAGLVTVDPLADDILATLIEFSKALDASYSTP